MGECLVYTQDTAVRFCHGVLWLNVVAHVDASLQAPPSNQANVVTHVTTENVAKTEQTTVTKTNIKER